ncbi:fimbrillin family protein [Porphyromonas levii]|uniref:fimbrillin family protein n=1 Tax=Porphyromonas levii TaxID=28114 RepID=UPI001B8CFBD0|nr:fimbrillin family protein [Porphyromonas levii]MBR8712240.1 hypothetical protein [Porphyromonas levii]MBR8714294.1 hypothetical protein [Porphyromonas levii]MBR8726835.1 hypothetical protein [Porphyromonas levii]MBR8735142.1 hypothetical protein [Porphyromonas levii]MBR8777243.1 hypothetical protein [Porphyromonas levii]
MTKTNFTLFSVLLCLLASCQKEVDYPEGLSTQPTQVNRTIASLRASSNVLGEDGIHFSIWDTESKDSLLITEASKKGDVWLLDEKFVVDRPSYVSAVYPSSSLRVNEAVLITEQEQTPVYYSYVDLKTSNSKSLTLNFKLVQAKINIHFDLSSFPSSSQVSSIRFVPRYSYGWLNLKEGVFNRMNTKEYESPSIERAINKTVKELVSSTKTFDFEYYMMPQEDTDLAVFLTIDGIEHYSSIKFKKVRSNTEYNVNVDMFNRKEIIFVPEEAKRKGMDLPIPQIEEIFFTDYEFTTTHEYLKNLSNNSGVVFQFWLDSRIDYEEELEYRLLIRDVDGKVVSQSPIYSGVSIKPFHYDGFMIPFYLSVPKPGKYQYQLLLKGRKNVWYEPNQKYDDNVEDKFFEVHPRQDVFVSAFNITETSGKTHSVSVNSLKYNTEYKSAWILNNYSSTEQKVMIRVYNRRQPYETHSKIKLDETSTWLDQVGEATITIPPMTAHRVEVPYTITKRHPRVNRFLPYICATITYHSPNNHGLQLGKEYPLLADGDILYRRAYEAKNPSPFVGGSLVNNVGHIDVE